MKTGLAYCEGPAVDKNGDLFFSEGSSPQNRIWKRATFFTPPLPYSFLRKVSAKCKKQFDIIDIFLYIYALAWKQKIGKFNRIRLKS
jgi:hypothetical protein